MTASAWVSALRSRGATLELRKNRVYVKPRTVYDTMTDEEALCLRHHRDEIKAVLRDGGNETTAAPAIAPMTWDPHARSLTLEQWQAREAIVREHNRVAPPTSAPLPHVFEEQPAPPHAADAPPSLPLPPVYTGDD